MKNYLSNIPESIKETLRAIGPLIVVLILFILVGKFGISKVTSIRDQTTEAKQNENVLSEKMAVLQSFSQSSENNLSLITTILPKENSSIMTASQLKMIAAQNGAILTSLKSGSPSNGSSGLSYADITFEATGTKLAITAFLNNVANIAPISQVQKVRMSENGGLASANIVVRTFWAAYPKTIPSVTQSITNLTAGEKDLITQISGLIQPIVVSASASEGEITTVPFGE